MIVAIDGPAGSGKSTVAREVARRLGLAHLDTGAMYRAATFAVLVAGVDPEDEERVAGVVADVVIDLHDGTVLVDGRDATEAIRGSEVSGLVSVVAALPAVRADLRDRQRSWVEAVGGAVVEGRDIGTVVFPDATLKVFLTAEPGVRARRRAAEQGGADAATVAEWAANIAERDRRDATRSDSPLRASDAAMVVDTGDLDVEGVVNVIMERLGR